MTATVTLYIASQLKTEEDVVTFCVTFGLF